jgi:hypothetical protein
VRYVMFIKNIKIQNIKVKNTVVLLLCLLAASCANTSLTQSWKEPEHARSYKYPMIMGISDSQQTRRIYENHFVAQLKEKNITAIPSYTLISSKQEISRETIVGAIQDTRIDSVLVTYLVSADVEMKHRDSPINPGYSGNVDNNMVSETLITTPGRYVEGQEISLKNDFYDVQSESIVWSAQTKTVAAESIDEIIKDVTALIIKQLFNDNILK